MRIIRFGIVAFFVFFAVMTLLSLLVPSSLRVMRVVNVGASRQRTLATVSDLRSWMEWNSFVRSPRLTHKAWSNPADGKGAWMHTDQISVQETGIDSDGIALNWDLKGGKQYAGGMSIIQTFPDSVSVEWWFDLHFRWYPWEKLGVFVYDRKLGPAMEESLDSLKRFVENTR